MVSLAAVLLAAGRSSRMGRPKLLLPWGATSVLGHLLDQWQALKSEQIAVVCAADDLLVQAELDRLGFSATDRILNVAKNRGDQVRPGRAGHPPRTQLRFVRT